MVQFNFVSNRKSSSLAGVVRRLALSTALVTASTVLAAIALSTTAVATCNNAGPPYSVPGDNVTVNLDAECPGVGGTVNVIGTVDTRVTGGDAIFDAGGNQQNWNVVIANGVSVLGANEGFEFNSPNASLNNQGTVSAPTVFNGVFFLADGQVTNSGSISGQNAIAFLGAGAVNNSGILSGRDEPGVQLFSGGSISNLVGGSISSQTDEAIRYSRNFAGTVINAGTITGGNGNAHASTA